VKYVLLIIVLLLGTSLICYNIESKSQSTSIDYQTIAHNYLQQRKLKIVTNSESVAGIQLPDDFGAEKDGVKVGHLLWARNIISKQNNLGFASYMGQKLKAYTAQIDTGNLKTNYAVVLLITDDKVIGFWNDAGMIDPEQNKPDFQVLLILTL